MVFGSHGRPSLIRAASSRLVPKITISGAHGVTSRFFIVSKRRGKLWSTSKRTTTIWAPLFIALWSPVPWSDPQRGPSAWRPPHKHFSRVALLKLHRLSSSSVPRIASSCRRGHSWHGFRRVSLQAASRGATMILKVPKRPGLSRVKPADKAAKDFKARRRGSSRGASKEANLLFHPC